MAEAVIPSSTANGAADPSLAAVASPAPTGARGVSADFEDSRPGKKRKLNTPPSMTAASAQAEARDKIKAIPPSTETSPNPAAQVLSLLMGSQSEVSKTSGPQSPNPATTLSAPMAEVAANLVQTAGAETSGDSIVQTSPVSMSSIGTLESLPGPSGMATTVGSPLPMDGAARQGSATADAHGSPEDGNKAFTFPPPLLQPGGDASRRGMSLPGSNTRQGTRSPSSKKHRCPYCSTEFTRHHNLKSHLLTHSQEKPYVCSTCQSRFRRLHDLKRHTKLHTGERPHICPKCGRKFARGDALARHNKGPGGCAGRRASMGSFGDDDMDGADDSMDGVMYNEPDAMDEDDSGMQRPPSIRRQAPSGDDSIDDPDHSSRIPSTYPPIQGRPPGGIASGSFPPRHGGYAPVGSSPSGSGNTGQALPFPQPGSGSGTSRRSGPGSFAQNPLTESPKPLSPGQSQRGSMAGVDHNRSPSITHFQTGSYPRSGPGSGSSSLNIAPNPSTLPPPPGLNPPEPRYTLPSQGAPTHPPTQPTGPPNHMGSGPLSSHSNSLSSHGQSGHGSGEAYADKDRLWAVIKNLENRVNNMQDEINSLRSQLAVATGQQQVRAS